MQEIYIRPYHQIVYAKARIRSGDWDTQTSLGFWDTSRSPNSSREPRPCDQRKKKERTCRIVDFSVSADHRVKIKGNENRDKYVDLARELKSMKHEGDGNTNYIWCAWNDPWKLGHRTRRIHPHLRRDADVLFKKNIFNCSSEDESIPHHFSRSTRILRRVLQTWEDLLSVRLWPSVNAGMKKLHIIIVIIIIL